MMPTMRAVAAAPLEAPTAAIRAAIATTVAVAAAMGTIGTSIGASAAPAETASITAAVTSAALRALEAGTRIGADAGKIFSRRAGIAWTPGFPGQEHGVIFNYGFDGRTVRRDRSRHGFGRNVLDSFIVSQIGALSFGHLLAVFYRVVFFAGFGMRFRMSGFRGELRFARLVFRVLPVFTRFLFFFGLFFVVAVLLALVDLVRFVKGFGFVFVKIRATDERVGFGARLSLFVLGFHQASGERHCLFVTEGRGGVASRFG